MPPRLESDPDQVTYPLGAVVEATGLSEHVLRAWERRHSIVRPQRTAGGSRRYRTREIDRLRLTKAAVEAGHRIGDLADLSDEELRALGHRPAPPPDGAVERVVAALQRFDENEAEREIGTQLSALGAVGFCRSFVGPLLWRIGEEWEGERLCVASEHLGSALLRSALGGILRVNRPRSSGPTVLFTTLTPEAHELGVLMAAIVAASAGITPCFLGSGLPVGEIVVAASGAAARAVAVSVVSNTDSSIAREVRSLRRGLPRSTHLWIGGRAAPTIALPKGAEAVSTLEDLESRSRLLVLRK